MVFASFVEGAGFDVVGITIRPVYFAAVFVVLLLFRARESTTEESRSLLRAGLGASVAIALLAIVPAGLHQDLARVAIPGLLVVNIWLAVAVAVSVLRLDGQVAFIELALAAALLVPFLQTLLVIAGVVPPYEDARLLNLGRAPGTFEEATWIGAVAAVVLGWAAVRRSWWLSALAALVLILSASRAAIIAGAIGLTSVILPRRPATLVALLVLLVTSILFTPLSMLTLQPSQDNSSLDSRVLDQRTILDTLSVQEWIAGGDELRIYDHERRRAIPTTSNNVYVDMVWKEGIFGLAILAVVGVLVGYFFPRSLSLPVPPYLHPSMLIVMYCLGLLFFANNALLRSWFWVLLGVGLGYFRYTDAAVEGATTE